MNDGSDTVDNVLADGYTWSIYLHGTESAMEYQRMFLVDDRDREQSHVPEYTRELAMMDLLRSAVTRGEFNELDRYVAVRFSSESKRYPQGMPFSFATETTVKMRVSQCPKDYSEALDRIARLEAENANLSNHLRECKAVLNVAMDSVDQVFETRKSGVVPILPAFMALGECKFAAVVRLAREYVKLFRHIHGA